MYICIDAVQMHLYILYTVYQWLCEAVPWTIEMDSGLQDDTHSFKWKMLAQRISQKGFGTYPHTQVS